MDVKGRSFLGIIIYMTRDEFLAAVNAAVRREAEKILVEFHCQDTLDMVSEGKRLRPLLVYGLSETVDEQTVQTAVAIELFHAATLVHDDIIDNASTRRGHPTISAAYSEGMAIMVGNALFARAVDLAGQSLSLERLHEFVELYTGVAVAQNDELLERGHLRSEQTYERICRGKTGLLYTFCVTVGDAPAVYAEIVGQIAYAFQIVDDIDDLVTWRGEGQAHASKQAEFDIDLGNITLPVILAFARRGVNSQNFVDMAQIDELSQEDWTTGIDESRARAAALVATAREKLASIADSAQKTHFSVWAEPMMQQLETKSASIDSLHV